MSSGVFAAGKSFDFSAVSKEGCFRPEANFIREMVVEGITPDQAANTILAVLAPEYHADHVVSVVFFVGKNKPSAIWIKRPLRTPLVTIRLELIASVSVTDPRDKAIKPRETPRRSEQPYTASKSAAGRAPRRSARAARVAACRARVILKAMMQLMDAKMRRTNAPM